MRFKEGTLFEREDVPSFFFVLICVLNRSIKYLLIREDNGCEINKEKENYKK